MIPPPTMTTCACDFTTIPLGCAGGLFPLPTWERWAGYQLVTDLREALLHLLTPLLQRPLKGRLEQNFHGSRCAPPLFRYAYESTPRRHGDESAQTAADGAGPGSPGCCGRVRAGRCPADFQQRSQLGALPRNRPDAARGQGGCLRGIAAEPLRVLRGRRPRRPVEDRQQRHHLCIGVRRRADIFDRRCGGRPVRRQRRVRRHRRGESAQQHLLRRRRVSLERRRYDLDEHRPPRIWANRQAGRAPDRSRHRLCCRAGAILRRQPGAWRVQNHRRRSLVDEIAGGCG